MDLPLSNTGALHLCFRCAPSVFNNLGLIHYLTFFKVSSTIAKRPLFQNLSFKTAKRGVNSVISKGMILKNT